MRPSRISAASLLATLAACGAPATPRPTEPNERAERGRSAALEDKRDELEKANVFDARGGEHVCEAPRRDCPPAEPDTELADRCRLAGFQVRRCGCDVYCAGDVSAGRMAFDGEGRKKECAPARTDCEVPPASAAFQDACTDRGHKLKTCGCEWLCTGDPTKR